MDGKDTLKALKATRLVRRAAQLAFYAAPAPYLGAGFVLYAIAINRADFLFTGLTLQIMGVLMTWLSHSLIKRAVRILGQGSVE